MPTVVNVTATGGLNDTATGAATHVLPDPVIPPQLTKIYRRRKSYSYTPPTVDTATNLPIPQTRTLIADAAIGSFEVTVGGVAATWFRGHRTAIRAMSRAVPGGPRDVDLHFPAAFIHDGPGSAAFPWLKDGASVSVRLRKPYPDLTLDPSIAWEYYIHRFEITQPGGGGLPYWVAKCKGSLAMAEDKTHTPPTTFFTAAATDIGARVTQILNFTGRRYAYIPSVVTSILTTKRGALGQSKMQAVLDLLGDAWTDDGRQWTVQALPGPGRRMQIGLPTIDVDYHVTVGAEGLDLTGLFYEGDELPNVVYGEYVTPDGYRSQNLKTPHAHLDTAPAYPGPPVFNPGDATTGFAPFANWLRDHGGGDAIYSNDTYDSRDEDNVRDAQARMGITVDGVVGAQTWGTAFNTGANVGDLGGAFYAPLAADPRTQPRSYTPDGQDLGANPAYDPTYPIREVYINFGSGVTRSEVLRSARLIVARNTSGWAFAGQVTMTSDPEECSRLVMLEGKVLGIRHLANTATAVALHIADVEIDDLDADVPSVTLSVDAKFRDAPTIAQLIENRRDAKNDPARQRRLQETGKLSQTTQIVFDRDNAMGKIAKHTIQGGFWRIVRFPAGSYGTFAELTATTDSAAEFVLGLFVKPVTANFLVRMVGNPLDPASTRPFDVNRTDLRAAGLIQGWGSGAQPGGYSEAFTGAKSAGDALTGKIEDDTSTDWAAYQPPWLYLAEYCASTVDITVTFLNAPEQV